MKTLAITAALLVLSGGIAQAAEFGPSPHPAGPSEPHVLTPPWGGTSITQNVNPTDLEATSIHCGEPSTGGVTVHTDNSYIRHFFLQDDHWIYSGFRIDSVDFAIECAGTLAGTGAPLTQPVDVNLYEIARDDSLLFANLVMLGTTTVQIANDGSADGAFFRATMAEGTVLSGWTHDLVVELFTPEGSNFDRNYLWVGSNQWGETRPTYLAAPDCEAMEPTPLEELTDWAMHLILVVNGEEITGGTPVRTTTWGAVKALYE